MTKHKHKADARRVEAEAVLTNDVPRTLASGHVESLRKACAATLTLEYVQKARSSKERNKRKKLAKAAEHSGAKAKSKASK